MRQLPRRFQLALPPTFLLIFLFATAPANRVRAAVIFDLQPALRATPPSTNQNTASGPALAEATRLSLTVVELFNERKFDEALPLAKRALELSETALGPDHEMVQGALLNLAEIYTAKKRYGEAQKLVERLLKTYEKAVGPDDAGAAVLLDKLAFLNYMQGVYSKSETAYKRALAIREKAFGHNNAEYAASLNSLAEFYRFTGEFQKAQPLYEQALELRGKLLGSEHPAYLKTIQNYRCLLFQTHQVEKQKDFEKKVIEAQGARVAGIDGGVLNGRALTLPKPSYPDEARRVRAHGTVIIQVTIDEQGSVIEAKDLCGGDPLLVGPSLESARRARFTATKLSGQPVKVTGVITYNFVVR